MTTAPLPLQPEPDLLICDDCATLHRRITLAPAQVARCVCCDALLGRRHVVKSQGQLAFTVGALVLLAIGNLAPLASLDMRGTLTQVSLPAALTHTWQQGEHVAAALAAAAAQLLPCTVLLLRLYVLLPLARGRVPAYFAPAMRALRWATRWSMVEVFLMGVLVALVRSTIVAAAAPGPGLFAYAALTLLMTSITAAGLHALWHMAARLQAA